MGLFKQRKKEQKQEQQEPQTQQKPREYIPGAGGTIVTKSILEGKSKLKWFFRQNGDLGNGWIAFGDTDTQEYVNDASNMAVVDFNTLANIEEAVVNVFFMPVGTDLEFREDASGKYFVDTRTGREIRQPVPNPFDVVLKKHHAFMTESNHAPEVFQRYFHESENIEIHRVGEVFFPSGEVVLADPLTYLGNERYEAHLKRRIPVGSYPIELSIFHSPIAVVGLRIAAIRLVLMPGEAVRHEPAEGEGFGLMGVDAGMACITDRVIAREYGDFLRKWHKDNPDKNHYDDYFAALFQKSYEAFPQKQREGGDFIQWSIPDTQHSLVMAASGLGDGAYIGYWGMNEQGDVVELVVPFLNPENFLDMDL